MILSFHQSFYIQHIFTIDNDCQVPVDKHGSVKVLPPPPLAPPKESKVKYFNFAITKAIVNIFCRNFVCRQSSNRYETLQTGFQFEGLGPSPLGGLKGRGRGQN